MLMFGKRDGQGGASLDGSPDRGNDLAKRFFFGLVRENLKRLQERDIGVNQRGKLPREHYNVFPGRLLEKRKKIAVEKTSFVESQRQHQEIFLLEQQNRLLVRRSVDFPFDGSAGGRFRLIGKIHFNNVCNSLAFEE